VFHQKSVVMDLAVSYVGSVGPGGPRRNEKADENRSNATRTRVKGSEQGLAALALCLWGPGHIQIQHNP
jgi:hypothetical protein